MRHTGDLTSLQTDLLNLCGAPMFDIIATVINKKDTLVAEFQVRFSIQSLSAFLTRDAADTVFSAYTARRSMI
jgi:hypothetical protein